MESFDLVVEALIAEVEDPESDLDRMESEEEVRSLPTVRAAYSLIEHAGRDDFDRVLPRLGAVVTTVKELGRAALLAEFAGHLVDAGGSPRAALDGVLERLIEAIEGVVALSSLLPGAGGASVVEPIDEEALDALRSSAPEEVQAARSLPALAEAALGMLARSVEGRGRARALEPLRRGLERGVGFDYQLRILEELLEMVDGEKLLVLDPGGPSGWEFDLDAIRNNFHFQTLLQGALHDEEVAASPGVGDRVAEVVAVAAGEVPLEESMTDRALWDIVAWTDWAAGGSSGEPGRTIGGAGSPREIPMLSGCRIVLLAPLRAGASSWDAEFFAPLHPGIRAKVELRRTLSGGEVREWIARIEAAPRLPREPSAPTIGFDAIEGQDSDRGSSL